MSAEKPYIISIAGLNGVGKSSNARLVQEIGHFDFDQQLRPLKVIIGTVLALEEKGRINYIENRRHGVYAIVISKPKRQPCNHRADTKTTSLLTSKLTFWRQKLG